MKLEVHQLFFAKVDFGEKMPKEVIRNANGILNLLIEIVLSRQC